MKTSWIILLICFSQVVASAQLKGRVVSEQDGKGLMFASVGVIGTNLGTITNENGFFNLNTAGAPSTATVRVSMIGYEPKTFPISDLVGHENTIQLKEKITELNSVVIQSSKGKIKKRGGQSSSSFTVTGWGASGTGSERGTRIEVPKPISIEKVSYHIAYLGFDSVLIRFHLRTITNGIPDKELLSTNIMKVAKSAGWQEIDLHDYNLTADQDIAVTLEWVKSWGKSKDPHNGLKFSINWFKGSLFAREAGEGHWTVYNKWRPGIYLTVIE